MGETNFIDAICRSPSLPEVKQGCQCTPCNLNTRFQICKPGTHTRNSNHKRNSSLNCSNLVSNLKSYRGRRKKRFLTWLGDSWTRYIIYVNVANLVFILYPVCTLWSLQDTSKESLSELCQVPVLFPALPLFISQFSFQQKKSISEDFEIVFPPGLVLYVHPHNVVLSQLNCRITIHPLSYHRVNKTARNFLLPNLVSCETVLEKRKCKSFFATTRSQIPIHQNKPTLVRTN